MTNLIIGLLPVVKPEGWMEIEVGLSGGVYGVKLSDLKDYIQGKTPNLKKVLKKPYLI